MTLRLVVSLCVCLFSTGAFAFDAAATAEKTVAEWKGWMSKHGIDAGALIVAFDGEVVAEGTVNRSVDDPAKVASLSKAITAVCALKAADAAGKTPMTPLSEAMPAALAEHAPRDDRFDDIAIGHLITHTSGITSTYHRVELAKLRTFQKENKLWQFSKVAQENLAGDPGAAEYAYTNANYLALGLVIEELTGEGYEDYCQREVLAPLGIESGRLNKDWRVMSSWGGWEISARDYLTFAEHYFKGDFSAIQPAGFSLPMSSLGRGRNYSAGMIYRSNVSGTTAWHTGSWTGVRGRSNDRFGAYVAMYANGFTVMTNYAHDAWDRAVGGELDALLYNTMNP